MESRKSSPPELLIESDSKKRKTDVCFVCDSKQYRKRSQKGYEAVPQDVSAEFSTFLEIPASFFVEQNLKCHTACQTPGNFKFHGILKDGKLRSDLVKLQLKFQSTLKPEVSFFDLDDAYQGVDSIEAGTRQLRDLKDQPFSFKYFPCDRVLAMAPGDREMYYEKCRKTEYKIFTQFKELGMFKPNKLWTITNTSLASTWYVLKHDAKDRWPTQLDDKIDVHTDSAAKVHKYAPSTLRKKRSSAAAALQATQPSIIAEVKSQNKACLVCGMKPVSKLSIAAEGAFYRQFHVTTSVQLAYRKLMEGLGVKVFEPYCHVRAHKLAIKTVKYDCGLVEMKVKKKDDKDAVFPSETARVPFLKVQNVGHAILSWLINSDRERIYHRHPYQRFWERILLIGGDMGAQSTKLGLFDTHALKYNTGQKMRLLHMFERAPDSEANIRTAYDKDIAPALEKIQNSCLIRIRNRHVNSFAGALASLNTPSFIPTLFMEASTEDLLPFEFTDVESIHAGDRDSHSDSENSSEESAAIESIFDEALSVEIPVFQSDSEELEEDVNEDSIILEEEDINFDQQSIGSLCSDNLPVTQIECRNPIYC